jgi:hypothetical protein
MNPNFVARFFHSGPPETKRVCATPGSGRASLSGHLRRRARTSPAAVTTRPATTTFSPAHARPAWLSGRALVALGVLLALAGLAILVALAAGSVALAPAELWRGLTEADAGLPSTLVRELRLPRALSAFAIGGLLALAGVLMQILLRNPLADPYVLGSPAGRRPSLCWCWRPGSAGSGCTAAPLPAR